MAIFDQTSVGELVVHQPGRARVFERLGIDYCCHGGESLASACRAAGVALEHVRRELEDSDQAPDSCEEDWSTAPVRRLIEHIIAIHHDYTRSELTRLERLMTNVAARHGLCYYNLVDLAETFLVMKRDLLEHMEKEERVLFPMIRRLEAGEPAPFTVSNPIAVMEVEHRHASEALARLRQLTEGFRPPPDSCPTFQTILAGLADLEDDLHQHFHKENNILYPRAEKLEREVAQKV
jgi:regulator of cell morphogenesis and NO signaling